MIMAQNYTAKRQLMPFIFLLLFIFYLSFAFARWNNDNNKRYMPYLLLDSAEMCKFLLFDRRLFLFFFLLLFAHFLGEPHFLNFTMDIYNIQYIDSIRIALLLWYLTLDWAVCAPSFKLMLWWSFDISISALLCLQTQFGIIARSRARDSS